MTHLTINGELTIRRRAYWAASVGMFCPADQLLGIQHNAVSVGVRERCCQEALDSSFANVVRSLKTLGQLRLSEDRIRRIVEAEGKTVTKVRNTNQLGASFTVDDCKDGVMVTGVDGVYSVIIADTYSALSDIVQS